MPVRRYKPTSPGRRGMIVLDNSDITKHEPEKSLIEILPKHSGRSKGTISVRHQAGRHKRYYRKIDFKRDKDGVPARVAAIEYDPNRTARIALLHYVDGEKRYILAPVGLQVGDEVVSGPEAPIRVGNALALRDIPLGTSIHNIELYPRRGGQLVRAAGASAQLMAKVDDYAQIRMPWGEYRMVWLDCRVTLGQVGNLHHQIVVIGKTGRTRHMGRRPTVRGWVMNAVDHPHGAGEGKAPVGCQPKTPWGKPGQGYRT